MQIAIIFLALIGLAACNGQGAEPTLATKGGALQASNHGNPSQDRPKKRRGVLVTPEAHLQSLRERPVPALGSVSALTDDDYRAFLTQKEFNVLREHGTERAFTGEYNDLEAQGTFHCRACNAPVYTSKTKFDSKTGWPSFYEGIEGRVKERPDLSQGMERTEVICAHCSSHLGHVFEDGPEPTGLRHCTNSLSLVFQEN